MAKTLTLSVVAAAVLAMAAPGVASAAPMVRIRGAVARVVVIPEARGDVEVTVVKVNPRLPIRVRRFAGAVFIEGDVGNRSIDCHQGLGHERVGVWGRGDFSWETLPQIVIHTPMDVRLSAGSAVFGSIGRSAALDLSGHGCGDWVVGNVSGRMRLSLAGSGDVRAGSAGSADLAVAGSGDVAVQRVQGGVSAVSSGSGDITVRQVFGPLSARVAGSGNVKAGGGQVATLNAQIAGSGDVSFGGAAQSLNAQIVGSGDVRVARVTGPINRRVFGSGDVIVGR